MKYLVVFVVMLATFVGGLALQGDSAEAVYQVCRLYDSNNPVPAPWGQPHRVAFNNNSQVFSQIHCEDTRGVRVLLGRNDNQNLYTYEQLYLYNGQQWLPFTVPGASGGWTVGQKTINLPVGQLANGTNYVASYSCENAGTTNAPDWKCGCPDTSCSAPNWNLQAFSYPHNPGGTPGSTSSGGGANTCTQAITELDKALETKTITIPIAGSIQISKYGFGKSETSVIKTLQSDFKAGKQTGKCAGVVDVYPVCFEAYDLTEKRSNILSSTEQDIYFGIVRTGLLNINKTKCQEVVDRLK